MSAETENFFKLWICVPRSNKFAKRMWKDNTPQSLSERRETDRRGMESKSLLLKFKKKVDKELQEWEPQPEM